mmetsp:Transcript_65800/g.174452  ORF Transcript_65800/g.174452 Transcript_65800/m.174452 type:complete len:208 (-) Transcript_65800:46-669(-)
MPAGERPLAPGATLRRATSPHTARIAGTRPCRSQVSSQDRSATRRARERPAPRTVSHQVLRATLSSHTSRRTRTRRSTNRYSGRPRLPRRSNQQPGGRRSLRHRGRVATTSTRADPFRRRCVCGPRPARRTGRLQPRVAQCEQTRRWEARKARKGRRTRLPTPSNHNTLHPASMTLERKDSVASAGCCSSTRHVAWTLYNRVDVTAA